LFDQIEFARKAEQQVLRFAQDDKVIERDDVEAVGCGAKS
jgi:hypothetical protein